MEELPAYAHLPREGLVSEKAYAECLHGLFPENPEDEKQSRKLYEKMLNRYD